MKRLEIFQFNDVHEYLRQAFAQRQAQENSYSLSTWSTELGLSYPGHLSNVLNKRRPITAPLTEKLAENLGLNLQAKQRFRLLVLASRSKSPEQKEALAGMLRDHDQASGAASLELDEFKMIKDWHHVAILELAKLKGFKANGTAIAKLLKNRISPMQAELALERLERLGLLPGASGPVSAAKGGRKKKSAAKALILESSIKSKAIREHHLQNLKEAMREIAEGATEDRYMNATTIAVREEDYEQLIALHDEFRKKVHALSCNANADQLVRVQTQIIKLT